MTSKTHNQTGLTLREGVRGEKACRNLAALLSSFLLAFVFASIFTPISTSSAAEVQQTVNYNNSINGYSLSFTSTGTLNVSMDAVPAGNYKAVSDTLTTKTNVPSGYKLSISTEDNSIYNVDDIDKVSTHLSPVSSTYPAETTLNNNQWGFKVASVDEVPAADITWSAVPTVATKIKEYTSPTPDAGDTTTVSYGFRANTALPAGTYSTTITYTVYAENAEEFPYMQDFTTTECNAMEDNQITTLTDKRDGKAYRVTKMKDGNCWMSQNLALDGGRTLTPEDSNVTTDRELNANIESGVTMTADRDYIYGGDANKTITDCGTYPYCVVSDSPYGNYYNWVAATAGVGTSETTGTVFESVCPKGWRLPDNGTTSGQKTYSNLFRAYNLPTTNGTNSSAVQTIQYSPLSFPLTSLYSNSATGQTSGGRYWSRTSVSSATTSAYNLSFNSYYGYFDPQYTDTKSYGFSVRCVFEGDTVQDSMFMQDVNLTMCNNLAESTASSDNRRTVIDGRDNKTYRISHLADGNCWMVQNLALDGGRDLFPGSSNVTAKRTLSPNIENGTAGDPDAPQIYAGVQDNTITTTSGHVLASDSPFGNLYNWNAATATVGLKETTDTVYESVCPAGWRLPDNGTTPNTKTWSNLFSKYGYPAVNTSNSTDESTYTYIEEIQLSPLHIPMSGYHYWNGGYSWGYRTYLSTRVVDDENSARTYNCQLRANDGYFAPQSHFDSKASGLTVRCVLGE